MPVTIVNKHPKLAPATEQALKRAAERLLEKTEKQDKHVTAVFTDDAEIAALNQTYRHKKGATNVLSFPFEEAAEPAILALQPDELGDIVISVDRAIAEARKAGQQVETRLRWLLVHGYLHLLGYDHERSERDAEHMQMMELQLLDTRETPTRKIMPHLAINVDHVATIRQARGISEPDPVSAAAICEFAGAEGIVVHLREDRRHIQDRDVRILRETVQTKLNLEMGAAREIIDFALDVKPDMVTLVPEKRKELTTEGGLNVAGQKKKLGATIDKMNKASIPVSLFIDPDLKQVKASLAVGATFVEIHTGTYADALDEKSRAREYELIREAAFAAHDLGLRVNAGHGLNYVNTPPIAAIDCIEELSIGHAIISRAVFSGLEMAVRDMRDIISSAYLG